MSDYYGRAHCGWSLRRRRGHGKTGTKSGGTLSLPGGREVPFRIVSPEDASALKRFLGRCSERTIYLRFFGSLGKVSEQKAQYLTSVDGTDHFGLVALDPDDQNEITAMVRYDRESGEERAEYAAIVQDGWQDQGLAGPRYRDGPHPQANRGGAAERCRVLLRDGDGQ